MMKLVSRGDTTVVDAYLSPILRRYVDRVATQMPGVRLFFMQSSGGLTDDPLANEQSDGIVVAAGRVGFGMAADTTLQQVAALTQVNFGGPAQLITELVPALRGREDAFIAAITGVVAEKSFPGMSAYCASKSAFSAWLGSLAFELRRDKIKVIDARPGHTETGLATRPLFGAAPQMPQGMTAEHVVGVVVAAIAAGTTVVTSTDF